MTLLRSPETAVHLVTVLEEMPVQETADGVHELTEAGLPVGAVVVNQVRPSPLPARVLADARAGRVDRGVIAAGLEAGDLADLLELLRLRDLDPRGTEFQQLCERYADREIRERIIQFWGERRSNP